MHQQSGRFEAFMLSRRQSFLIGVDDLLVMTEEKERERDREIENACVC